MPGLGMCQCPKAGFFHFYVDKLQGVNGEYEVSMPLSRLLSFLLLNYVTNVLDSVCVNALKQASFISTRTVPIAGAPIE